MAELILTHWPAEKRSRLISASPIYYGWIVVAAATIGMAMTIPGQTAGVSLFIDQIMADLSLTRSTVSLAYTVATILGAASLSQIGRWIDRFGPRKAVVAIVAVLALACGVMSMAAGLATLFVGFVLLRAMGRGRSAWSTCTSSTSGSCAGEARRSAGWASASPWRPRSTRCSSSTSSMAWDGVKPSSSSA